MSVGSWGGVVPPIPASFVDPVVEEAALLMWVRHGGLTVRVEDLGELVAGEGEAVWVPPGLRHDVETTEGAVVLPVIVEAGDLPAAPRRAGTVVVPPEWSDWLTYRVARWFGFSSGAAPDAERLLDLLAGLRPVGDAAEGLCLPDLPRSAEPRAVVERLLRDPACGDTLAELAASVAISSRTLQRQLKDETGLSLAQWRTAARIDAAAGHLARGRDLGWVAHHVGYRSVSGFAHAFAARTGVSPGRYAAGERATEPDEQVRSRGADVQAPPVPTVPSSAWIAQFDSVLWIYRGSVRITAAGRVHELAQGDVIWLGQGASHHVQLAPGSIVLPLGFKPTGPHVRVSAPRVLHTPLTEEVERYLLHAVVANHFLLRPRLHDPLAVLAVIHPPYPRAEALPAHVEPVVAALTADPADSRGLADWARELDLAPADLGREFAAVMGEPFPRWRAKARMTEARTLLWEGRSPSSVARRLGYAHLSAFSKAFTAAHGIGPREWIRRDAG